MPVTVKFANANISGRGVKITAPDIQTVTAVKGCPTTDAGIVAWSALVALVRVGQHPTIEVRTGNGAGTLSDDYILANYQNVPHVIIDGFHLVSTSDARTIPNSLGNNIRKPVRDRHGKRPVRDTLARRLGIAGCVSWARYEDSRFVFLAHDSMANYL
jgi:hypothetical protein